MLKACFSSTHSVFIVEGGYVFTMGRNKEGQRGIRHCNPVEQPTLVEAMRARYIVVGSLKYVWPVNKKNYIPHLLPLALLNF